jgi:hypothetical protein
VPRSRVTLTLRIADLPSLNTATCRPSELSQELALFDAIADVDIALGNVASGAGINVRVRKRSRRPRQGDRHDAGVRLDRRDVHAGHEITLPFGCRHDLLMLRIVTPCAERDATGKQQKSAKREQTSAPSAPHCRTSLRRALRPPINAPVVARIASGRVVPIADTNVNH